MNVKLRYKTDQSGSVVTEIWCAVCRQYADSEGKKSSLVSGNEIVKKESITYHLKSSLHVRSIAADKKSRSEPTPMEQALVKMNEATMTKMNILVRTVFYLVKNERPLSDFPKLLEL